MATAININEYIAGFPETIREILEKLRITIRKAAPEAKETINYAIPTFTLSGNLVHFAAFKNHIGFYPAPSGIEAFKKELSVYEGAKGSVQFPIDKPLPTGLITKIVKFRVKENLEKAKTKKNNKADVKLVKSKKPSDEDEVNDWLNKQDQKVKDEINAVRKIIKNASAKLSERIKWNAPSYYYKPARLSHSGGEDIVTFGPYKNNKILLVFHHPSIVKIKSALLEGDYTNRRLLYLANMKAIKENKKELERIMNESVKAIEKNQ